MPRYTGTGTGNPCYTCGLPWTPGHSCPVPGGKDALKDLDKQIREENK